MPGNLVLTSRAGVLSLLVAGVLAWSGGAPAPAQAGSSSKVYFGEGPLPPLPEDRVRFDVEVDSDEEDAFRQASTAPTAVTGSTTEDSLPTWRIADWGEQLDDDILRIERLAVELAEHYDAVERGNFPVAVRHLKGSYESVAELERLAKRSREVFLEAYPPVRRDEVAPQPPEQVRRARLFRERAESIHSSAKRFLNRAVEVRESEIVWLEDDE